MATTTFALMRLLKRRIPSRWDDDTPDLGAL